jgi:potassium-transporting ATPase KdpC subunit
MIRQELIVSLRATAVTLVLTGLLYPLLTTAAANVLFPRRAEGSFVEDERGNVVGSELIAEPFAGDAYLQPRPSAAGEKGWDASGSGGSNLGPTSRALRDRAAKELERLSQGNPDARGPVPAELVSASASGLDPHLSPGAALWQVPRIARARGVSEERVQSLVDGKVEGRDLLVLGEPRVNVLLVNLALDRTFGRPPRVAGK